MTPAEVEAAAAAILATAPTAHCENVGALDDWAAELVATMTEVDAPPSTNEHGGKDDAERTS